MLAEGQQAYPPGTLWNMLANPPLFSGLSRNLFPSFLLKPSARAFSHFRPLLLERPLPHFGDLGDIDLDFVVDGMSGLADVIIVACARTDR